MLSNHLIAIVSLGSLITLIGLGFPISIALLTVGAVGLLVTQGWVYAETQLFLNLMEQGTNFSLLAIPLYLLMGQLVFRTGLAGDMYGCIYRWVGRVPGGLAVTSVIAAAGFGAVSGGSASTVATLGPMCMPEMRKFKYDGGLAGASIAVSGTLGILIPPSIFMIAYGIWTETSIAALFLAGIIPGIILCFAFSTLIICWAMIKPEIAPVGERFPIGEKIRSLASLLPIVALFTLIIGGIYGGVFDPTEAAAIGVVGVLVITGAMRRLTLAAIKEALFGALQTGLMIFMVIIGGHVISRFLVLTDITADIVTGIQGLGLGPYELLFCITLLYIVLGMILDIWAMLILTIPFVFPVVIAAGFDPVWFGIYVIIMCELCAITPPVGLNVYIMSRIAKDVDAMSIFKRIVPFFIVALACLGLFTAFPEIVLILPRLAFG